MICSNLVEMRQILNVFMQGLNNHDSFDTKTWNLHAVDSIFILGVIYFQLLSVVCYCQAEEYVPIVTKLDEVVQFRWCEVQG